METEKTVQPSNDAVVGGTVSESTKIPAVPPISVGISPSMPRADAAYLDNPDTKPSTSTIEHPTEILSHDDIKALLSSVSELVDTLHAESIVQLQQSIDTHSQPIAHAEAATVGSIGRKLDQQEAAIGKVYGKVIKPIRNALSESMGYLSQAGVVYPTNEQVVYGLQTGDYMGSVGLPTSGIVNAGNSTSNQHGATETVVKVPYGTRQSIPQPVEPNSLMQFVAQQGGYPVDTKGGLWWCVQSGDQQLLDGSASFVWQSVQGQQVPNVISGPYATREEAQANCGHSGRCNYNQCPVWNVDPPPPPPQPPTPPIDYLPPPPPPPPPECCPPQTINVTVTSPPPPPPPPTPPPDGQQPIDTGGSATDGKWTWQDGTPWSWDNLVNCFYGQQGGGKQWADGSTFGFKFAEDGNRKAPQWFIDNVQSSTPRVVNQALWGLLAGIDSAVTGVLDKLTKAINCPDGTIGPAFVMRGMLGFLDVFTGGQLRPFLTGLDYELRSSCPQELPSASEATSIRLAGEISAEMWECWQRANNKLINPALADLQSKRHTVDFRQALTLFRWGKINEDTFRQYVAKNGVLNMPDRLVLEDANLALPGPSDLMRFMVRDTADAKVVADYKLDTEFNLKWKGDLASMGWAQGLSNDIALHHWRAHWQHPSATQVFEMLHRLRPEKYPNENFNDPVGERQSVTLADAKQLLAVNDLAPIWRERLAAISYRPISRGEAEMAYMNGLLDRPRLVSILEDEGNDHTTAVEIASWIHYRFEQRKGHELDSGVGQRWVTDFVDGFITEKELADLLVDIEPDAKIRKQRVARAKIERGVYKRKRHIMRIKRQFQRGSLSQDQAYQDLISHAVPDAMEHVSEWAALGHGSSHTKHASAAELCQFRDLGLIDGKEQISSLLNLGYSALDAERIVAKCASDLSTKQSKQLASELKRQYADQEKQRKAAEKADKAARAAERKAKKDAAAQTTKAQAAAKKAIRIEAKIDELEGDKSLATKVEALTGETYVPDS